MFGTTIFRMVRNALLASILMVCSGCSSLGLTLWPSQLPMLSKAKDFAARSPLPSGLEHELAKQVRPDYFVEPGDRLLVEPIELDSEFQAIGDQKVKLDGSIDLGRYGRIRVAGMTMEMIEVAIAEQIASAEGKREIVNVQLLEANAAQVYVLGAVGSPGAYDLDGNETVLDAILMAGGLTSTASPCDIILVRPTDPCEARVVQRICFRQITQLGDVTTNYQMQPGDRVVVGERTLCEELAFWKQSSACPCCDRSKRVECQPAAQNYRNRFTSWLAPLPLPLRNAASDPSQAEAAAASDTGVTKPSTGATQAPDSLDAPPTLNDDSDIFLPPELPTPASTTHQNARPKRANSPVFPARAITVQ